MSSRNAGTESGARGGALLACAAIYLLSAVVAVVVGTIAFKAASGNPLVSASVVAVAAADVAATIVVFIFSVILDNSSVYDPYWSVAPPFIAAFWIIMGYRFGTPLSGGGIAVVVLLLVWAGRLTFNWARGWQGFAHEDWRYVDFRRTAGRAYWLVSFLGIHFFPTILVLLGSLSLLPVLAEPEHGLDLLWIVAILIIAAAVWVEAMADRELFEFKRNRTDSEAILDTGLWSYSRHPNYFGEVLFWWGVYLAGLAANPSYWWTIVGPVAITTLFAFVSVPMMERHMSERHPAYLSTRYERSPLVPWFRR